MRRGHVLIASVCTSFAALASPAAADDVVAADALFEQGLADMKAGRYETGCPALAESHRIDPRPGRLFTLAECEAQRGRIATAVARYGEYLALFDAMSPAQKLRQRGRGQRATEQRTLLGPEVPQLTVTLAPDAPKHTAVKRDDELLGPGALGLALPIDPGEHVIAAEAPGIQRTEVHVTLNRGETKQVTLEVKPAETPLPPQPVVTAPPPQPSVPAAPPGALPPDQGIRGRRIGAYVVGGVGLAGLVTGVITGGLVLQKKSVVEAECSPPVNGTSECKPDGKLAGDSAKTLGLASTIGFSVAAAGLGAAVVLFATMPRRSGGAEPATKLRASAVVVQVGPGGTMIGLRGRF